MEMTKNELKNIIKDWQYSLRRLEALKEKYYSQCYSITPSYSSEGGSSAGVVNSKVERYYLAKAQTEEAIKEIENKIVKTTSAMAKANLTQTEKMVICKLMEGRSLSGIAKEKNIYISNVYKIRDKAIAKIHAVLTCKTSKHTI